MGWECATIDLGRHAALQVCGADFENPSVTAFESFTDRPVARVGKHRGQRHEDLAAQGGVVLMAGEVDQLREGQEWTDWRGSA